MTNFSNYELDQVQANPKGVYALANGLIPEIANLAGYALSEAPNDEELRGFVGLVGPDKELQKNISRVTDVLGDQATETTADWVERSGVLAPVNRAFKRTVDTPASVDTVLWSGGVANWMLRRRNLTERLDPQNVGQVLLPLGTRNMGNAEHQFVATLANKLGRQPTEAEFAETYIIGGLSVAGFDVEIIPVDSTNGDDILDASVEAHPEILDGSVLVVANAPNAIQGTGQFRLAAKRQDASFDAGDTQLYMMGDTIPVARNGEGTATHQNPKTALGQIARNALFLHQATNK